MSRFGNFIYRGLRLGLAVLSYVLPKLAGRIATRLWFTPFPMQKARSTHLPAGALPVEYTSNGLIVRGYEVGDGPHTALLIHGWAGSSRQYRRIASRLAEDGYRSVVLDLPAHGVEAGKSTNLYEIAEAIEAAARSLGSIDLIVAHSLGAMAASVAMQESVNADRLAFLAPGLRPRQALDVFSATLGLRPRVTRAIEGSMESRFGGDIWERVPRGMLELQVPARTLVIHDESDEMVPIDHARLLAESWGVRLLRTEGHGHNGMFRAPEVIDQIAALARAKPALAS